MKTTSPTRRTVCEIRELATVSALNTWAHQHQARVRLMGADLEGRALYAATCGPQTRVARSRQETPRPHVMWHSPLATPGREWERW
jgi:hypothetical protein